MTPVVKAVQKVSPAVVNITTVREGERTVSPFGQMGQGNRITSYNVCYTKLLRKIDLFFSCYQHCGAGRELIDLLTFDLLKMEKRLKCVRNLSLACKHSYNFV